jgi:hypothetical protein
MDKSLKHKVMLTIGVLLFVGSLPVSYALQKWVTPIVCTPPSGITGLLACVNISWTIWFWSLTIGIIIGTGLILWSLRIKNNK